MFGRIVLAHSVHMVRFIAMSCNVFASDPHGSLVSLGVSAAFVGTLTRFELRAEGTRTTVYFLFRSMK